MKRSIPLRLPAPARGWWFVGGVAVLFSVTLLLENRAFPRDAIPGYVIASMLGTALVCLVAYPFPLIGLVLALILGVVTLVVPGMPHGGGTGLIVLLFLVAFLAYRLPGRWGLAVWLLAALTPGLTLVLVSADSFEPLFYLLFLAPAWVAGTLLQREQRRSAELTRLAAELAAEREHRTQSAIAAERLRIARELHDAVAHSVSVMTLQIGVVRRRLGTVAAEVGISLEQQTLEQAERLGRQSVEELRRIVGITRERATDLTPLPSLANLDELLDQVRRTGTAVEAAVQGELTDLPSAVDMSAYRVVQEALTNALKHAPGAPVRVTITRTSDAVHLAVRDRGPRIEQLSRGNGLLGMAERVAVNAGELRVEPHPDGGVLVEAVLPLTAVSTR